MSGFAAELRRKRSAALTPEAATITGTSATRKSKSKTKCGSLTSNADKCVRISDNVTRTIDTKKLYIRSIPGNNLLWSSPRQLGLGREGSRNTLFCTLCRAVATNPLAKQLPRSRPVPSLSGASPMTHPIGARIRVCLVLPMRPECGRAPIPTSH